MADVYKIYCMTGMHCLAHHCVGDEEKGDRRDEDDRTILISLVWMGLLK